MPGFGTSTSSLLGANFNNSDSTALFALGTLVEATNGQTVQYVEATSTLITGELVLINPAGTAKTLLTANLTANAEGYEIGAAQNIINQGEFGWVARNGRNLYVLATGTLTAGSEVGLGFSANSGRLESQPAVGVGQTAFGIYVTTSASTATASVAVATLTWPRPALHQ